MRKLIITRGPQGAGKSTSLREAGLGDHTLTPDALRRVLSGPYVAMDGGLRISQHLNNKVFPMMEEIFGNRVRAGETIGLDATFVERAHLTPFLELANQHDYDVLIVDFSRTPMDLLLKRNAERNPNDYVPRASIERVLNDFEPAPDGYRTVFADEQQSHIPIMRDFVRVRTHDLSEYEKIVHVGDLQGCESVLREPASPLAGGINPRWFYILGGDYIDRGIENAEALRFVARLVAQYPNVVLLRGNHERHLENWAAGRPSVSREFAVRTQPALEADGITPESVKHFVAMLHDVYAYTWNDKHVLVTHAGLPSWPHELGLVPTDQYIDGVGGFDEPIDYVFSQWSLNQEAKDGIERWQIHGHRNSRMLPVIAGERSINLEGQVEFGGQLRAAILDQQGFTPIVVPNRVFRPFAENLVLREAEGRREFGRSTPVPTWIRRGEGPALIPPEALENLRNHDVVKERVARMLPHVSAFNFSKSAFDGDEWDDVSLKARGLFVDVETGRIVARSYEKFFNVGEREDTKLDALSKTLQYPVTFYNKENGFLGITGYDERTDSLVIASKSMLDDGLGGAGDASVSNQEEHENDEFGPKFARWFREILDEKLGEGGKEKLRRLLRDLDASAVFEVIDPARDPHIIEHAERGIVLLDIIRRGPEFEKLGYEDLKKFGRLVDVPVKERAFVFDNPIALERKIREIESTGFRWNGKPTEGFVIEDAAGFQTKIKSGFYRHWKGMRTLKDRILAGRSADKPIRATHDPEILAFTEFCRRQPDSALAQSIIGLRNAYVADPSAVMPGENFIVRPPERDKVLEGYVAALDAVGSLIKRGEAKPETIEKLVLAAERDERKRAALLAHPVFAQLVPSHTAEASRGR